MSSILIVEDETRISNFVEKGLRAAGYSSTVSANGLEAAQLALTGEFDLMLLDVGLPGIDGFEVLRRVREFDDVIPVIMLTARTALVDTVQGLDDGANDYVPKPFKIDELLARVRARLREAGTNLAPQLSAGELALDLRSRRAAIGDRTVELSAREFALAEEFVRHRDQVLSREQLRQPRLGLRLRPEVELRRCLCAVPAEQVGRRTDRHCARRGLPIEVAV